MSDDTELEKLKKAFVLDANYSKENIAEQLKILVKHASIDKEGKVFIKTSRILLSSFSQIFLALISRFVANQLGENVPPSADIEELSVITGMDKPAITARLAEMVNNGDVLRLSRGNFQIRPSNIDEILQRIDRNVERLRAHRLGRKFNK